MPLGYRVEARKLLIDDAEAAIVRQVFERYLALGSLSALQAELRERGVAPRRRVLASGRTVGGGALTNGPLAHLLRNRPRADHASVAEAALIADRVSFG